MRLKQEIKELLKLWNDLRNILLEEDDSKEIDNDIIQLQLLWKKQLVWECNINFFRS